MPSLFTFAIWIFASAVTNRTHPVLDVKVRSEDRDKQLVAGEMKINGIPAPYAAHRPKAFYYLSDVTAQKKATGSDAHVFLVAGLNCDETIRKTHTITGVEINQLSQRGRGGNQGADRDPAWAGINNKGQRSSFEGFLKSGQSIRDVLLSDNIKVREAGVTHQAIAAPILAVMEQMMEMVEQGKDWDPQVGFEFVWEGTRYNVKENTLGVLYFAGLSYDDNMKKIQDSDLPAVRSAARKKAKSYRTGWTGAGIQGSFFNDDIYSTCSLTFTDPEEKRFAIDCLTPHLIYRYGFYQGGTYRKDPEEIIRFFKVKASEENKKLWAGCH